MIFFAPNRNPSKLYLRSGPLFLAPKNDSWIARPIAAGIPTADLWPRQRPARTGLFEEVFHTDQFILTFLSGTPKSRTIQKILYYLSVTL